MRILGDNMAAYGSATYVRPNIPDDMLELIPSAKRLKSAMYQPIVIDVVNTAANAAAAEMSIANSVLDGTGTAVLLHVKSDSADDTDNASKDARAVKIIGLTCSSGTVSNPEFTVEEIRMNGLTGVATTRYYVRVLHAYVCAWGSAGDDAAGNITVQNVAEAVTYLTIAAGSNESDGCAIYVPNDYTALIETFETVQITGGAAGRGTQFYIVPTNLDDLNAAPNCVNFPLAVSSYSNPHPPPLRDCAIFRGKSATYSGIITFMQAQIGGAETYHFHARVVLYGHTTARRSLTS